MIIQFTEDLHLFIRQFLMDQLIYLQNKEEMRLNFNEILPKKIILVIHQNLINF